VRGQEPEEIKEQDRYDDYIRYVERRREAGREEQYWKTYLGQLEEPSRLPFIGGGGDRTKGIEAYREEGLVIGAQQTEALRRYCRDHRLTLNTLVEGVWAYLLYRYTGRQSVVYGVTVSGRPEDLPGMEQRVGMYTNTIPLYTELREEAPVVAWLQRLQQEQTTARDYQYSSLVEIQGWTGLGTELFDTMLSFQNYPVNEMLASRNWQLKAGNIRMKEQGINYPLSVRIMAGLEILIQFIYKSPAMTSSQVQQLKGHFENILSAIINNPTGTVRDLGGKKDAGLQHANAWAHQKDLFDF